MINAPTVYVCTTCKRAGEPDSEPRPGALLAAATERAAAGTEVDVRRLRCLANCTRGPSAAMRCNGSWTYVFGGLDATCADALIEGARLLEPMCILWISYGMRTNTWNHAFKLLRK